MGDDIRHVFPDVEDTERERAQFSVFHWRPCGTQVGMPGEPLGRETFDLAGHKM